jgi:hypothetical protein
MCARWKSILSTLACASIASILVLLLQKLPESTTEEAEGHLIHCEDAPVIPFGVLTPMGPTMVELTKTQDTTHQTASAAVRNLAGWVLVSLRTVSRRLESPCGKTLVTSTTLTMSNPGGKVMSLGMTIVERRPRTTPRATTADQSAMPIAEVYTTVQVTASRLEFKIQTEDQNTLAQT